MPVRKKVKLEKTIFDEEFVQDRADRRAENGVDAKLANEELRRCFDILAWQMEQPVAAVFLEPVDWKALDLPLYPQLIKHPMDYGTIKTRLLSGQITTPSKFAELMRLVYKNAMKFNQAGSQIYEITQKLLDEFEGNYEHVKVEKPVAAPYAAAAAPYAYHQPHAVSSPMMASHTAHLPMQGIDPMPASVNPYAELESQISALESRLAQAQEETATLKQTYQTKAEEQALLVQPHLRIAKFDVAYPRKPFTFEEKEALCERITQINDQNFAKGLLDVIQLEDNGNDVVLDVENFDDDTLHRIADYLSAYEDSLHSSSSRYGYGGDDEDYLDSVRRKKKNKV